MTTFLSQTEQRTMEEWLVSRTNSGLRCPVCGSPEHDILDRVGTLRDSSDSDFGVVYVRCRACGFMLSFSFDLITDGLRRSKELKPQR